MKAFLFDVDDTLYDQVQPFARTFYRLYPERKDIDIHKLFARSRVYSDEVFEDSCTGKITMEEMYIYRVQKALADFGIAISDEQALVFQKYYEEYQGKIELSEQIQTMLQTLSAKENIQLGVITNGPNEHQWDKVRALDLQRWIPEEHVFVSGEIGINKPQKEIFAYAEKRMNLAAEDAYFIGDSPETDIAGAKNAGWHSIWFNRRRKPTIVGLEPEHTVMSEEALAVLLKTLY